MIKINDFKNSLAFVLKEEVGSAKNGGYTNDPTDPGGETKYGISKRAHPNVDIANLTPQQAADIYANEYWDALGCDNLTYPYSCVVFDSGVNCGVSRAAGWLRKSTSINDYLALRRQYYIDIINKNTSLMKYAKGWWNRMADLRKLVQIALTDQQPYGDQVSRAEVNSLDP
ncbi:MAG: glycoside hydrolase family 108 protein [Nitrosotalea sp.]